MTLLTCYMSSKRDDLRRQASLSENGRVMGTCFTPTPQDVERYRRLRSLQMDLNRSLIKTVPRHALDEVGDALGILHNGVLEIDNADMSSVVMDCCLYDWFEGGSILVKRYPD